MTCQSHAKLTFAIRKILIYAIPTIRCTSYATASRYGKLGLSLRLYDEKQEIKIKLSVLETFILKTFIFPLSVITLAFYLFQQLHPFLVAVLFGC